MPQESTRFCRSLERRNEPVLRRRSSAGKKRPIGCETPDALTDRGLHCHGMSSLLEVHKRSCVFKLHYQFLKREVACCIVVGGATRQRRLALQHTDTLWPSAPQRLQHSTPSLSLPIPSLPHCLLCVCFPTFVRSCGVPVVALRVPSHAPWLARRALVHRVTRMTCHARVQTGGAVGAGWDLD